MKRLLLILIFVSLSFEISNAYENVGAHRRINKTVVEKFLAKASTFDRFKNYSFVFNSVTFKGPAVVASGYFDITTANKDFTIKDWIIEGGYSADEPEAPAALRHFYDPLANNQGKYYLTDLNVDIANPAVDAIFWHFDGYDPQSIVYEWSWNKGKEYMAKALEANDENQRNTWIAKAFRSLGEVLHNTADMGCPPHVRNDAHGGFPGVGGSDPYESGFNPDWAEQFSGNNPDPSLASYFSSSSKAININKKLAEFTNKYFFTNETIYGKGVASYKSRNKMPDYPSPLLENLEYEDDSFNYNYTFPSGRKIELCNDRSLFLGYISQNFRAYPRVTQKNVESQAQELVPNIISAGVNVVRNFIPQIEFILNADAKEKKISGEVRTITNDEYTNVIKYNGVVKFRINGTSSNTEANCVNGKFETSITDLKQGDKIVAYIVFADIIIKSNELLINAEPEYKSFTVEINGFAKRVRYNYYGKDKHAYDTVPFTFRSPFARTPFVANGNNLLAEWNYDESYGGINHKGSINMVLNSNNTANVSYINEESYSGSYTKTEFEAFAIPFDNISILGSKVYSTNELLLKSFSRKYSSSKNGEDYEEYLSVVFDSTHKFYILIYLFPSL